MGIIKILGFSEAYGVEVALGKSEMNLERMKILSMDKEKSVRGSESPGNDPGHPQRCHRLVTGPHTAQRLHALNKYPNIMLRQ